MSPAPRAGTGGGEDRSRSSHPVYLPSSGGAVFATAHLPDAALARAVGVLFVPPFGWDELCTHRSLRAWAAAFADAGHPALCLDLPGTGDSSGSARDDQLVARWTDAVADAAAWLREAHACTRVVAIGIGLGGMIATAALAAGAPIDDLVLWAVQARGKTLLRELTAFATMATAEVTAAEGHAVPAGSDGSLEVAGFVLPEAVVRSLEELDLSAIPIPDPAGRRVLLLGRDGIPPDRRLHALFEVDGIELSSAEGDGFGAMVTHPQFAVTPDATIAHTVAWAAGAPAARTAPAEGASARGAHGERDRVELESGGVAILERPFEVPHGATQLRGVLATPADGPQVGAPLAAVLLNAGSIRRIGPNRMWVETARRWAGRGIPTLRIDMLGLGDSDGDGSGYVNNSEFYKPAMSEQVSSALDALQGSGVDGPFFVAGLCSGAYWAYHAALADARVQALGLINLWAFEWSEEVHAARDRDRAKTLMKSRALIDIARVATGRGKIGPIDGLKAALRALRPSPGDDRENDVRVAAEELRSRALETLFLFSLEEPLFAELERFGELEQLSGLENVTVERIPVNDHIFRPLWAQEFVHGRLDAALERSLARARNAAPANR